MAALRDPETGCPWDRAQTFATIAPYTVEEAYEVADAVERGDLAEIKDELGDLLLQVVFHARMAEELGAFDFADGGRTPSATRCCGAIRTCSATANSADTAGPAAWEAIKAGERAAKGRRRRPSSTTCRPTCRA